jgi:hypothetical protein
MNRTRTLAILIFDDVEVLDFCGPFEVFSVTRLHEEGRREELSPFEVLLVAEHSGTVVTTLKMSSPFARKTPKRMTTEMKATSVLPVTPFTRARMPSVASNAKTS